MIIKVKETSLPDIRLEIIDTKNPGWSVRNERHTVIKLILVDLVEDEEVEELLQRLTMRSKETEELVHSSDRSIITFLLYIGLAIELNITFSQSIISDHRLPSFCQLDLQEASKLTLKFSSL